MPGDLLRSAFPLVALAMLSCTLGPKKVREDGRAAATTSSGIDLEAMDRSVAPGDDFFSFANGSWIRGTEIPADWSTWGIGAELVERTARRTADLIAEASRASALTDSNAKKIGDFYSSFMDEAGIESKGIKPLKALLDEIAAIAGPKDLARFLGSTLRSDVDVLNATRFYTDNLFGLWVAQDLDRPERYSPFLLQGGLGMPDRDYYVDSSPRMADIRVKYGRHLAAMLKLSGIPDSEAKADRIFELERQIALVHASRVESADVVKGNNHWLREDFETRAPGLDWSAFFEAAALGKEREFVVWHPRAVSGIAALVRGQPLSTWKDYLAFHAIEHASSFLPPAFVNERFAFFGKVLTGTPKLKERWKRAVAATDAALGEAVGQLYVARYFPAADKARVEELVRNEVAAFRTRIDGLSWMTLQTKERAKAKLTALKVGVGYPEKWRDYSGLEIIRGDALGNFERASKFDYQWNLKKLGRTVDRSEWVMNPQLVNAVNLPAMNAINFPAAILQPPYLDASRPLSMDYGAIGATIGHEISHSFDDQGALFDATGRLHNWWTDQDLAHFQAAAEQLIKQYDAYRPFPDLAVNGRLTVSENIADVAGLSAAYDAYRLSLGSKEAPLVEGLTGDQQFFLSFAQHWRQKPREAALRQQIVVDSHAPARYRAATVRNLDAWYEAFGAKEGQALYLSPVDRVRVW